MRHRYRAFGLCIRSDIVLPELTPGQESDEVDLEIGVGALPPGPEGHHLQVESEGATLWVSDASATYRMVAGRTMVVDSRGGEIGRNVRLYLLGSALGVILHQRGLLPLHACALSFDGQAFAVLGRSGAGKSTLAAALAERGGDLLSDDVCVLVEAEERFAVAPGIPRLRLWRETLEARGERPERYPRSFEDWDKYDVPAARMASEPAPLRAVFLLDESPDLVLEPLAGAAAVEAVAANTYRGSYVRQLDRTGEHLRQCVALVRQVPVERFSRPPGLERLDESVDALLRRMAQLPG